MKQLYVKATGVLIIGTFDKVPGCAGVSGWEVDEKTGKLEPVHDMTGTEMYWDDQYTETAAGTEDRWLVDENNEQVLMSDCELRDDEENEDEDDEEQPS